MTTLPFKLLYFFTTKMIRHKLADNFRPQKFQIYKGQTSYLYEIIISRKKSLGITVKPNSISKNFLYTFCVDICCQCTIIGSMVIGSSFFFIKSSSFDEKRKIWFLNNFKYLLKKH